MEFCYRVADFAKGCGCCLHDQEPLLSFFHFVLPSIDGGHVRNDVDAGGEPPFDEMARDFIGFVFRAGGGKDDSFVGHIESGFQLSVIELKE